MPRSTFCLAHYFYQLYIYTIAAHPSIPYIFPLSFLQYPVSTRSCAPGCGVRCGRGREARAEYPIREDYDAAAAPASAEHARCLSPCPLLDRVLGELQASDCSGIAAYSGRQMHVYYRCMHITSQLVPSARARQRRCDRAVAVGSGCMV